MKTLLYKRQRSMAGRFISIWFKHLTTDWMEQQQPALQQQAFVLAASERGRMVIKASSAAATACGIDPGTVAADARTIFPNLKVMEDKPELAGKLLDKLAAHCIRYTPVVAIDPPDGLILDISGCAHLWGGERAYLQDILHKLKGRGFRIRAAIADTIGTAWAVARYGKVKAIIAPGEQYDALLPLPPAALRLEHEILDRMHRLGLYQVKSFIDMPGPVLRRRFGQLLPDRIAQALGKNIEPITSIQPIQPYAERLPSLEPIRTAKGIEIALLKLLETLCQRLLNEGQGLRVAVFSIYPADGKRQQIEIGTNKAVRNVTHLYKLFELKIASLAPGPGIELFLLEAPLTEPLSQTQESLWNAVNGYNSNAITQLLDRLTGKAGANTIHRYLPAEHYWPERSVKLAASMQEKATTTWRTDVPRPVCLLPKPEKIEVAAPIPDYPPMLFNYQGKTHKIVKADGPERIEQEWWLELSLHRDYYCVEDDKGARYWLFRLGHYGEDNPEWFLHGFFA